jgi:hypothetical protein
MPETTEIISPHLHVLPRRVIDLTGQRFGRLTVLSFAGIDKHRNALWLCRCDCEKEKLISGRHLHGDGTKSCECLMREIAAQKMRATSILNIKHGHAIQRTPEYHSWTGMRARCCYPRHNSYQNYGGRGIRFCDRWRGEDGFENFLEDLGPRPVGTTLGRFGDIGNYEPGNVKWMTRAEQEAEKRKKLSTSELKKAA